MSEIASGLYPALLAAQRSMGPVKKDANNPAFRTKYATLQSVLETIDAPLAENGLVLLQRFEPGEGGPVLITEIVHAATGDRVSSALPIVSKDPTDPQKLGGAITYARRYSLLALLGLAPEDDDGNAASQPGPTPAPRPAPAPRPTPPERPQEASNAPAGPDPRDRLTDQQEHVIANAWDMAERGDTFPAVIALLKTLQVAATPDQWTEIKRALAAIKAAHYTPKEG